MKTLLFITIVLTMQANYIYGGENKKKKATVDSTSSVDFYKGIDHLVSFSAVFVSGKAYLNWKVLGEEKDCIYLIERSTDGNKFENIGSKEGHANNLEKIFLYSWADAENVNAPVVYYRIKRIDESGNAGYSAVKEIFRTVKPGTLGKVF